MRGRTAITASAVIATAVTGVLFSAGQGRAADDGLSAVRQVTAKYHDVNTATSDGFAQLTDAAGIACIVDPDGAGTMGIHYVLMSRVGDPSIKATEPELVIYQPQKNGQLKLVAVEYVVVAQAWADAGHAEAPSLFGRTFTLIPEPNRYGLPPFFELHAWAWDHNKSGDFADYNPGVSC
jgi:hypothetical protein